MEYIGFIASIAMGIILGVMGGGGSILTVPILVYLFSLPPVTATGYSLFVVGITALIGSIVYIRRGEVDFQTGITFAIPSVIGVNISRGIIIPYIPDVVTQIGRVNLTKDLLIMITFAGLMIAASYSMITKKIEKKTVQVHPALRIAFIAFIALAVGIIAGFIGAGGGFLLIPALVLVAGLSMRVAVGTSLMIIAFQSLLGFAGDLARGINIDWRLLTTIATAAIIGIILGSRFSHKVKEQKLKVTFGWFILFMGIAVIIEQLRHF